MKRHSDSTDGKEDDVKKQRLPFQSDEERLSLFQTWLQEHNTVLDNVEIRQSILYKGFALYSTSSQEPPNIQIPTSLIMSNQSVVNSSTFVPPSSDVFDQTDDHIDRETLSLALFLIHERGKGIQSHWYPYIQILPHTFTTPLLHKDNYLENTSVFYLAQTMRQSMTDVCDLVGSKAFTVEDFLWAYTVISSRAFKMPELGTMLIPLADLANHVSFAQEANLCTVGIDKETDRFLLKTTDRKILAGDELCIKYNSELANWQLLLYYGFTIENNTFDSILLELKMNEEDTYEMEMKKTLLLNLSDDLFLEHELQKVDNEPIISENLLATLRLIVMTTEELDKYNISNLDQLLSTMVNNDNERRALNQLLLLLNEVKAIPFTTTLEENLDRFQSNQLDDEERYSLIYLIGQKRIIENACQWTQDALSRLD